MQPISTCIYRFFLLSLERSMKTLFLEPFHNANILGMLELVFRGLQGVLRTDEPSFISIWSR